MSVYTQGIYIDGTYFDVPLTKVKRKAPALDKYANRNEAGDLEREMIGVYFNYEMELGDEIDFPSGVYQSLHTKLTQATPFHTITLPEYSGSTTFTAYASETDDEWDRVTKNRVYYKNLTFKFIAKSPRYTP